ncbi:MAG: type VI secretion system protein TssA [Gammaproteobacteria bacterium]
MTDLSNLLTEISPGGPCGENLEYDNARIALDTNIQGTPENQFTGEKAQPPAWRDIQKEAKSLLLRSKDLQVMLYLIRALIPTDGINGFRDGINLLSASLNGYWDHLHPQLDPSDGLDPTLRVNILEELNSLEFVIQPLSRAVLVDSKSIGQFALRDIQYATDKLPTPESATKPDLNTIKAAFQEADLEQVKQTYQAITESIALAETIESFVAEKVGVTNGPNLDNLRSLLKELRHYVQEMAESRLSEDSETESLDEQDSSGINPSSAGTQLPAKGQSFVAGKISSRHDVIKALDSVCLYYREFEPSSPVPVLLERAKYLATADFMAIVKNMLPDALGQLEILKGPDPNEDQNQDANY